MRKQDWSASRRQSWRPNKKLERELIAWGKGVDRREKKVRPEDGTFGAAGRCISLIHDKVLANLATWPSPEGWMKRKAGRQPDGSYRWERTFQMT